MYPYGVPQWRCNGKNHPSSARGHVPQILRLDSTGEVSSDDNPMYSESVNCPLKAMGSLFDTAFRKFGQKPNITTANLAEKQIDMASDKMNNITDNSSQMSWRTASQAWGGSGFLPCLAPRMASQQKMLSELPYCTPLFQSNSSSQSQHYQFHPAMGGVHVSSKKYNRYRNCHPSGINIKHGKNDSQNNFPSKNTQRKGDVNLKSDIKVKFSHCATENNKCEEKKRQSNNKSVPVVNGAIFDYSLGNTFPDQPCTNRILKDNNIHVLASTASDSHKSTLDDCDILKAAYINSFHQNDEDVPLDWFDGGYCNATEESDSINSENVKNVNKSTCEEETRHTFLNDDTDCEIHSLQRECSILSDSFAEGTISMTCLFQDIENNIKQNSAENSESASAEIKPVQKQKIEEENATENSMQNEKEEKTEVSGCRKTQDYSFILHVRDNKKWRSSAKKRRRKAKPKKEEYEEKDNVAKNCKEENSPTNRKNGCNKLAFILGFDPKTLPSSPEQTHSFFVSFSESDSDFSEDEGFSDEEDQQLNCAEFSCPLDLNVICSITHSQPDGQETSSDIDAINKLWDVNIKVNSQVIPPKKSNKKVHFAEAKRLCEIHPIIAWSYAYQAARKGPWEEYARDRERFQRRVFETEKLLAPVFDAKKRQAVYKGSVLKTESVMIPNEN